MRLDQLGFYLRIDLLLRLREERLLDLKEHVGGSLHDLVLDFNEFVVALGRKDFESPFLLSHLLTNIIHDLVLLLVVRFKTPFKSLLNDLNNSALGANLARSKLVVSCAMIQIGHVKLISTHGTASHQLRVLHILHTLAQFGVAILHEVLNDFDPRNDDFFKNSLSLVHFDKVGRLKTAGKGQVVKWHVLVVNRRGVSGPIGPFKRAELVKVIGDPLVDPLLLTCHVDVRRSSTFARQELLPGGIVVSRICTPAISAHEVLALECAKLGAISFDSKQVSLAAR